MPRRGENIRKRKDGRWEGRYISRYDESGKAKYTSVYGKSYADVKQKLMVINHKRMLNEKIILNQHSSYRDILYQWLDNNSVKLKEQTYIKYYQIIEKHIVPMIGNIEISKVDTLYLNKIILEKSKYGNLQDNSSLSPNYIRTIAFILKSSISYAAQNNYCLPLTGKLSLPNKSKKMLDVYTTKEQMELERICKEEYNEKSMGILISLYSGLRIGEVCGLKWSDVNFENNTIHIQRTIERLPILDNDDLKKKTKLIVTDTKTISSNRIIPLSNKLMSFLLAHKGNHNDYIIKGSKHEYIDPRTLQYYYHNLLINNHIRYLNFHALRHTFATRCIESGMDTKSLSEILGHSDVNITLNTYVHSSLEHKRIQMETMSTFLNR